MMRQYFARRCRVGDNPLRVGVIAVGSIYYVQDEAFFRDRHGPRPVCRTPSRSDPPAGEAAKRPQGVVEAFLNGTCGAARRNRDTGLWESAYRGGRSDTALVRSLRDQRQVRLVSVHLLAVHEDLGLWKEPTAYPSLPDIGRFYPASAAASRAR